jgi:hypothetical protein
MRIDKNQEPATEDTGFTGKTREKHQREGREGKTKNAKHSAWGSTAIEPIQPFALPLIVVLFFSAALAVQASSLCSL